MINATVYAKLLFVSIIEFKTNPGGYYVYTMESIKIDDYGANGMKADYNTKGEIFTVKELYKDNSLKPLDPDINMYLTFNGEVHLRKYKDRNGQWQKDDYIELIRENNLQDLTLSVLTITQNT